MSIPGSCVSCMAGTALPEDMHKHRTVSDSHNTTLQQETLRNETRILSVAESLGNSNLRQSENLNFIAKNLLPLLRGDLSKRLEYNRRTNGVDRSQLERGSRADYCSY